VEDEEGEGDRSLREVEEEAEEGAVTTLLPPVTVPQRETVVGVGVEDVAAVSERTEDSLLEADEEDSEQSAVELLTPLAAASTLAVVGGVALPSAESALAVAVSLGWEEDPPILFSFPLSSSRRPTPTSARLEGRTTTSLIRRGLRRLPHLRSSSSSRRWCRSKLNRRRRTRL
jgi:hypothetical protein